MEYNPKKCLTVTLLATHLKLSVLCINYVLCLVAQLCPALCDPMDCSLPGSFVRGDSPGKHTGMGCHALLQGIIQTQESNQGLLHCRRILYLLSHQGNPYQLYFN